jgi:PAS domain S-box-containing protein
VTITEQDIAAREQLDRELTLARELALAIGAAETVDDAMRTTLREICETTGWDLGEAWVRRGEELELGSWWQASAGLERFEQGLAGWRTQRGRGLPGHAWAARTPIWMRDVQSDPRFLRGPLAEKLNLRAGVAVPVLSDDEVIAVLVFLVSEPREEDEHLIDLVSAVSAQLGALVRRKQAEDARRRSEEHLRAIADTAVDAIVSANSRGQITYFNKAAEDIFGYEAGDVLGKPLTVLMPERFHPAHSHAFERYLETGETHVIGQRVELAGRRSDGSEFPLELALSTWTAAGDVYFTGILRDITERRRTEEAIRQSDELKTHLLRSVSHDLRSPLTAIVAAGESSASPRLDLEGRRELASVIVNEGVRLSRLVDKLLDLSRLQSGAAAPRQVSCSLEEILQAAIEQIPGGRDGIEIDVPDGLPGVLADAMQLERAFANLFENASRFSGDEPVRVTAGVLDGMLVTRVADSGPGVSATELERIFEPFYRSADTQGTHPGSGLGLAIVRGFVEANGGRVWAEAGESRGTTFVVELPLPGGPSSQDGSAG